MTPYIVPSDSVLDVWHEVRDSINKGLKEGDGNFEEIDILNGCVSNQMTLWRHGASALVCQIISFPRKRVCHVLVLGGAEMRNWFPHIDILEAWAKSIGCHRIEELGRRGWTRVLEGKGWEQVNYQMRKIL